VTSAGENVLPFLQSNGYSPATQQNKLVTIKAFLEWCVSAGHLPANPLSGGRNRIRVAKTQKSEILSLGTSEARKLLLTALKPEYEPLAGWLALALFAGVRPDELSRTGREWLHLEEGTLRITAKASKTSQTRVIELHPTAIAWLQYWVKKVPADILLTVTGHRKRWERLRKEAGLGQKWVHDVLRHTFVSEITTARVSRSGTSGLEKVLRPLDCTLRLGRRILWLTVETPIPKLVPNSPRERHRASGPAKVSMRLES
jgi:integrase